MTPYAEGELYPAGYYPLEPNPIGIEQWTENNRSLVGKDLVLWHTMGVTHIPRPEDFPVMCVLSLASIWRHGVGMVLHRFFASSGPPDNQSRDMFCICRPCEYASFHLK